MAPLAADAHSDATASTMPAAHDGMPADARTAEAPAVSSHLQEDTAEAPAVCSLLDEHSSQAQDDAASAAAAVMPASSGQAHSSGAPAAFSRQPAARAAARSRAYCGNTRARFGQLRQPACMSQGRQEFQAFTLPQCDPSDLIDSWWSPQRCAQAGAQPDSQHSQPRRPPETPNGTR